MNSRLSYIIGANVFLCLHYAAILYVNSTYLAQYFGKSVVSLIYVAAAVLNIAFFLCVPRLLEWFGVKRLYLLLILLALLSLIGVVASLSAVAIAINFVLYVATLLLIFFCLDIFLEDVTEEKSTGGTRGLYLTLASAAIAVGPLLTALFSRGESLHTLYFISSALLLPALGLGFFLNLSHDVDTPRKKVHSSAKLPLKKWWHDGSLRRPTLARLVLEIFYTLMVVYTPIYLHEILGFGWGELGIVFSIMLLPFVILEWPMGVLADKKFGEKEIMSIGFFVTGMSLLAMPYLGTSLLVWTATLVLSRVGASLIEVTTESHFFKHVTSSDGGMISIFRLARPVGLILGSIIGAVSISLLSFEKIFFVVAIIIFLGLRESLFLKDTL